MENELKEIRKEIFLTGYSASIAHLASAFSIVEILYTLYMKDILRVNPEDVNDEARDIFILSKGHGSLALYSMLYRKGFFSKEVLDSFSKPGSILGGEPCIPHIPGVEATTGSLGHGLSVGAGMASAYKMDNKDNKVFVLLGDGECQEGTIWEAVMYASHQKLNNLIAIVDNNKIQKMDTLENVMSISSYSDTFKSLGWEVREVNGHDVSSLVKCFNEKNKTDKPLAIIANTIKGKGVSIVENNPKWHWKLPSKKELKVFMSELDISEEEIKKCKELM